MSLLQFALSAPTNVKLLDVNPRMEMHGKNHVLAVDAKVRLVAANTILDSLRGVNFRHSFYQAPQADGEPPVEPELDGMPVVSDTPNLRHQGLEPIRLKDKLTGYFATFDVGTGRKESIIELPNAVLSKFTIDFLQGGSCAIEFLIQASGLKGPMIGKLCEQMDSEISLLLEPPKVQDEVPQGTPATDEAQQPLAA